MPTLDELYAAVAAEKKKLADAAKAQAASQTESTKLPGMGTLPADLSDKAKADYEAFQKGQAQPNAQPTVIDKTKFDVDKAAQTALAQHPELVKQNAAAQPTNPSSSSAVVKEIIDLLDKKATTPAPTTTAPAAAPAAQPAAAPAAQEEWPMPATVPVDAQTQADYAWTTSASGQPAPAVDDSVKQAIAQAVSVALGVAMPAPVAAQVGQAVADTVGTALNANAATNAEKLPGMEDLPSDLSVKALADYEAFLAGNPQPNAQPLLINKSVYDVDAAAQSGVPNPLQATPTPDSGKTATVAPNGQITITPRTIDPEIRQIIDAIKTRLNKPMITVQDIIASPEYQALKQANDLRRGEAQAALRRSMASRGMLKSTPAIQALSSSDAYYDAQEGDLMLKRLAAAYDMRQSDLKEQYDLLKGVSGAYDTAYDQGLSSFNATAPYNYLTQGQIQQDEQFDKNFAVTESGVTGTYQGQKTFARTEAEKESERRVNEETRKQAEETRKVEDAKRKAAQEERDKQLDALDKQKAQLEIDIKTIDKKVKGASSENAAALAKIDLDKARAELNKVNADIDRIKASTEASKAQARADDALAEQRKNAPATKEQEKAEAKTEKNRDELVDSYTRDYNISRPASKAWVTLSELWTPEPGESLNLSPQELQNDVSDAIAQHGLGGQDAGWVMLMMLANKLGNSDAQEKLKKPPFRKNDISGKSATGVLK